MINVTSNHSQKVSAARSSATETRSLDTLREHPRQSANFRDHDENELAALVEDMRNNGLRNPILILPDGTIICGHQRVRAAKLLGWTVISCIVRHDLVERPDDVERLMIDDNLNRRQLNPLDKARMVVRLMELERGKDHDGKDQVVGIDLRDRIAKRIGNISGRTLDRYIRLLELPISLQHLVANGELNITTASRLLSLESSTLMELASEVENGIDIKVAIGSYLPPVFRKRETNFDRFANLIDFLDENLPVFQDLGTKLLDYRDRDRNVLILSQAHAFFANLTEARSKKE